MIVKVEGRTGEQIAKRLFYLAYEAAAVVGMGAMQAVSVATEDQVWARIVDNVDSFGSWKPKQQHSVYADYCFGRMMKFGCLVREDHIELPDTGTLRRDYQSWC